MGTLGREDNNIFRSVIPFVAISVVDYFFWEKRSAKCLFCDDTMLMFPIIFCICHSDAGIQPGMPDFFANLRCHSG